MSCRRTVLLAVDHQLERGARLGYAPKAPGLVSPVATPWVRVGPHIRRRPERAQLVPVPPFQGWGRGMVPGFPGRCHWADECRHRWCESGYGINQQLRNRAAGIVGEQRQRYAFEALFACLSPGGLFDCTLRCTHSEHRQSKSLQRRALQHGSGMYLVRLRKSDPGDAMHMGKLRDYKMLLKPNGGNAGGGACAHHV
jgi:hypothetical protein